MQEEQFAKELVEDIENDEPVLDISPYPEDGQVIYPNVPYTGALPAPLGPGQMIVLDGEVLPQATRFTLDLICGLSTRCDVSLHVNPRFDERRVVRNSRTNERWGDEEATAAQPFPLERGQPFFLYIYVTETQFMIAFDGCHFCSFLHRMPLWRVHALHVSGDIKVFKLEHRRGVTEYPQSGSTFTAATLAVPTLSCPINLDSYCSHITQPGTPFLADLPLGLEVGRQVELIGRVKILPNSFHLNLQRGKTTYPSPVILFHFNPRFKEGHIVVRNTKLAGSWDSEERASPPCPFIPGLPFLLTVRCEEDRFSVIVDGLPFITFKYRKELALVDTILVEGDVQISDIYIR